MAARGTGARAWRAVAAGVAALGLLASGCGSGDGGSGGRTEIRYSWWGAQHRADLIKKTIALFEKKHPDITIKADFQEYEDFWKKFNTQAAGGNPPDVFQNSHAFLRKYDDKNLLLDLKPQVKQGNLKMSDFRNGLAKAGEVDGKLIGVPVGSNTMGLFYNPKEYEKAGVTPERGWTWKDYYAGIEKISKKGNGKIAGDTGPGGVMYLYDLVLRQQGKAFFTKDALGFSRADLKKWWTDNLRRTEDGTFVAPKKVQQLRPKPALSAGVSAGEFNWDNFLSRYAGETGTNLDIAPIPSADGKRTGQYLSSLMLSGSARTQHPKEVAQFIDFMVHDPEVAKIMGYDRGVLSTKPQFEAYEPKGVSKEIAEYEAAVKPDLEAITPHPAGADVVEAAFLRIGDEVMLGKTSVDDGVDKFFSEAGTALGS